MQGIHFMLSEMDNLRWSLNNEIFWKGVDLHASWKGLYSGGARP